jgi:hypothetical protein
MMKAMHVRALSPSGGAELLLFLLVAAVGASSGFTPSASVHQQVEDRLRAEMVQAATDRARLDAELQSAKAEAEQALRSLDQVRQELAAAKQEPSQADLTRGNERGKASPQKLQRPKPPRRT